MLSPSKFHEAYANASESVKALIDSEAIASCIESTVPSIQGRTRQKLNYVVANYILGIIDETLLQQALSEYQLPVTLDQIANIQGCCMTYKPAPATEQPDSPQAVVNDMNVTQNPDGTNTYSSSQSSVLQQKNTDETRWGQV